MEVQKLKDKEIDLTMTVKYQLKEIDKTSEWRTENLRLGKAVEDLSEDDDRFDTPTKKRRKKNRAFQTMNTNNKENENERNNNKWKYEET